MSIFFISIIFFFSRFLSLRAFGRVAFYGRADPPIWWQHFRTNPIERSEDNEWANHNGQDAGNNSLSRRVFILDFPFFFSLVPWLKKKTIRVWERRLMRRVVYRAFRGEIVTIVATWTLKGGPTWATNAVFSWGRLENDKKGHCTVLVVHDQERKG